MRDIAVAFVGLLFVAGVGCKAKTTYKDKPETLNDLASCQANLKEKVEYINTLNEQITKLEGGGDGEVVVKIEGEVMTIVAGKDKGPHHASPGGDAKDAELYEAFVAALKRSRGAMTKCYQSALKKNTALSARTVTLDIEVNYKTNGQVKGASFNPRVSDQFNMCMRSVSNNWKLPAMPREVTFHYKQNLTPE